MFRFPKTARSQMAGFWIFALCFLLTTLAYTPGLAGPFLLDDGPNILQNPLLRIDGSQLDDWRTATFSGSAGPLGRPVAMFTFAVDHAVMDGFDAGSMKLVNLLLHTATGCLVYVFINLLLSCPVFNQLQRDRRGIISALAAGLWILHPLHVSTVLYVVQRMAILSTFFVLAGLVVYLRYRLRWLEIAASRKDVIGLISWVSALGALAVLSKENGVLLVPLIIMIEVLLFSRCRGRTPGLKQRPLVWCSVGALIFLFSTLFYIDLLGVMSAYQHREFTMLERLLTQGRVLWHYVIWLLLPVPDGFALYHDDIPLSRGLLDPISTLAALLAWLALVALAMFYRRVIPVFTFGVAFFLISHSLESSFLPLEMVYEHRNYLPSIGILLLVACALVGLGDYLRTRRSVVLGLCIILMGSLLAWRAFDWRDDYALMLRQAETHPNSPRSQIGLAQVLLRKLDESVELGLDEVSASIASQAKFRLEKAHALSPSGVGAPVLTLSLQTRWPAFGTASKVSVEQIVSAITSGDAIRATDIAALGRLVKCAASDPVICPPDSVDHILDVLTLQETAETNTLRLKYEWSLASLAPVPERIAILDRALSLSPTSNWANTYKLREVVATGDASRIYEVVVQWYTSDRERRQLPLIAGAFGAPR